MTDFAKLGIGYDPSGLSRARGDFAKTELAGGRLERSVVNSSRKMSSSMNQVAMAARSMLAPLATFLGGRAIVTEIADFETSMSAVAAITRATGEELAAMRDIARELGATTEFTAGQAAEGLKFLGMAGFEANEAIAALPDTLNLATAAGMDLGTAADIASNIMSGFQIAAKDAAIVTDILAAAASRSNTDVTQLGRAMKFAAPVANAMGISINDTAAAIGALSDAGLQSSQAGTGLRAVLASLAGPSKKAQDAFDELGLNMKELNPTSNALSDILLRLSESGMTAEQAIAIFGREAASAGLVLVNAHARVAEFGQELGNVSGEAQRMADTMRDNLGGDLRILASAISGLVLTLGDAGLTDALRAATQSATSFFEFLSGNVSVISDYQGYIYALAIGITATFVPAIYSAVAATVAWATSLTVLKAALIKTGIGALIVGLGYVIQKMIEVNEKTGDWGRTIVLTGEIAKEFFVQLAEGFGATGGAFAALGNYMVAEFVETLASMGQYWDEFYNSLVDSWNSLASTSFGSMLGMGEMDLSNVGNQLLGVSAQWRQAGMDAEAAAMKMWESANAPLDSLKALNDELALSDHEAARFRNSSEELKKVLDEISEAADEVGISTSDAFSDAEDAAEGAAAAANKAKDAWQGLREVNSVYAAEMERHSENLANMFARTATDIATRSKTAKDAVLDLLQSMTQMVISHAFQQIFSQAMGGTGGQLLVNALFAGTSSFDGGGMTPSRPRTGGIDGKGGFPAILHPNEQVIDLTKGQSRAVSINIDARGSAPGVERRIREEVGQALAEYDAGSYDKFLAHHGRAVREDHNYRNG